MSTVSHDLAVEAPTNMADAKHSQCHMDKLPNELLPNIFTYLAIDRLLLSMRVSRKWRATIKKSPELQQMLFLLPGGLNGCLHESAREDDKGAAANNKPKGEPFQPFKIYNPGKPVPSFMRAFGSCRPYHGGYSFPSMLAPESSSPPPPVRHFNPLLTCRPTTRNAYRLMMEKSFTPLLARCGPALQALAQNEASWAKMYIVKPPASRIELHVAFVSGGPERLKDVLAHGYRAPEVSNASGVTMLDVVDKLVELENEVPGSSLAWKKVSFRVVEE